MDSNACSKWMQCFSVICSVLIFSLTPVEDIAAAGQTINQQRPLNFRSHANTLSGARNKQKILTPKPVTSFTQLKRLLKPQSVHANPAFAVSPMVANGNVVNFSAISASSDISESLGYSETNVQVAGVDEGDIVKTDGQYIYKIDDGKVRIIQAYPVHSMAAIATLEFESGFSPSQLYVHGEQLIVLGSAWYLDKTNDQNISTENGLMIWGYAGENRTLARIYNIADRSKPLLRREIALFGDYVSSRLIGDSFYLIGRKYPNYLFDYFDNIQADRNPVKDARSSNVMTRDNTLPHISDSVVNSGIEFTLPLQNIFYFPNFVNPSYAVVMGLRLDDLTKNADIKAYLGSGDTVYASNKNLYISAADYNNVNNSLSSVPKTHFYKFALDKGNISFLKAGSVSGVALNSFAMDEHDEYFRVATTVNQWTQSGDNWSSQTWNNLYTLNGDMQVVGQLEHLAKDERIYSVRFMGDRCYLVTFRQTDPFFVIDLSTPSTPKVLGELKIPGFSFYLHPYDENHVIGFGQDTEDNDWGGVTNKGLKLSLFDVTDVEHPTQLHSLTIGEQGTYSPLQWDHKTLWFDKQRNLIGFPVYEAGLNQEGLFEWFQGAQIYAVNLADGFKKLAAITHQEQDKVYENWNREIQRLLAIEDQLYTFSETRIQANNLTEFKQTGFLDFPREAQQSCFSPLMPMMALDDAETCQIGWIDGWGVVEPTVINLDISNKDNLLRY